MIIARHGRLRLSFWTALILGLWGWSILAFAAGTSFGERDFIRQTGKPVVESVDFAGPPGSSYVLTVYNQGRRKQYDPVTSAVIKVNGTELFTPEDFKQQVFVLTRSLTFAATNTLSVELSSKPSSGLTIVIVPVQQQQPPSFVSSPVLEVMEDSHYRYIAQATDPDGDVLTYSLITAPAGMTIDASTGALVWVPDNAFVGSHVVTIKVQDPAGQADEQAYSLTVVNTNDAPVIVSTPIISVNEDELYRYAVQATDADLGDVLGFQLVSAPAGLQINAITGVISWAPGNVEVGTHLVTLIVVDAAGASVDQSFTLTVINSNDAPVFTSTPPVTAIEDQLYLYDLLVGDIDAGDSVTYRLERAPSGMTLDAVTGQIAWMPYNADVGDHEVRVVARDSAGAEAEQVFFIGVVNNNDTPVLVTTELPAAIENEPYIFALAALDEDVGDALTVSVTNVPSGLTVDASSGVISWLPGTEYGGLTVNLTVTVTDRAGAQDSRTLTLEVINVNDSPIITSSPANVIDEKGLYHYQVVAIDPDIGDSLSYALVSAPTSMTIDPVTGLLSWIPGNADVGAQVIVVAVRDATGAGAEQMFTLQVVNINDAPVIQSIPLIHAAELASYSYVLQVLDVDAGDTLQFSLVQGPQGMTLSAEGILEWVPDKFQGGQSLPVTVSVKDLAGAEALQTFMLEVANVNTVPVITSTPALTTLKPGDLFRYPVVAIDSDGDFLQFTLLEAPAGMTIDTTTGVLQWQVVGANTSFTARLQVSDGQGGNAVQFITLVVLEQNLPPSITSTAVQQLASGETYRYQVTASDPNLGDVMHFGLLGSPEGMVIDASSGQINWTPQDLPPVLPSTGTESCLAGSNVYSSSFNPVVKWVWPRNTASQPVVAPIRDTNGDGRYDEDDVPTVIALNGSYHNGTAGRLFALDGKTGQEVMEFVVPAHVQALATGVRADSHLAVGDLEGDGVPDIVGYASSAGGRIITFNSNGTFKWLSEAGLPPNATDRQSGVQIFDLDNDGKSEIVANQVVLNYNGTLRFMMAPEWTSAMPIAADLDLDGYAEVVIGNIAYRHDGAVMWTKNDGGLNGNIAIGQLDDDPYPEIVSVTSRNSVYEQGQVDVRNHDGSLKWRKLLNREAGPPSIADLDNDGRAEIIIGSGEFYRVFTGEGVQKFTIPAYDDSKIAGSSSYDFDNDGVKEVVYNGSSHFYIANGMTGEVKVKLPRGSLTGTEYPAVADVDGDGHADVIVQSGGSWGGGGSGAFVVYSNSDNNWAPARKLWNQHGYNPQLVADNLSGLPAAGTFWQRDNSFRQQRHAWSADLALAVGGLTPTTVGHTLTVTVTNRAGGNSRAARLVLRADQEGSPIIASTEVSRLPAGGSTNLQLPLDPADRAGQRLRLELTELGPDCYVENNVATFVIVGVEARDEGGLTDEQFLTISATGVNRAPLLQTVNLPDAYAGGVYNTQLTASDPDTIDKAEFSLQSAPPGLYLTKSGLLYGRTSNIAAGVSPVKFQIKDLYGGVSTHELSLNIIANHPPVITSVPVSEANGEVTAYTRAGHNYQVVAQDPDGDPLTYSYRIVGRRVGHVPASGTTSMVTWANPTILTYPQWVDDYDVYVDVTDNRGMSVSQQYFLRVKPSHVPFFISTPPKVAVPGVPYVYNVLADAPHYLDENYNYIMGAYPQGMALIDPGLGMQYRQVTWMPTAAQIGNRSVSFTLYTKDNAAVPHSWTISVVPGTPPDIQSQPKLTAKESRSWGYQLQVSDPDGQQLTYKLISGPAGMMVSTTGLVSWLPGSTQVGSQSVTVQVSDGVFTVDQSFTLNVLPASVPLGVTVTANPDRVEVGQVVAIALSVNGAGSALTYQLQVNGQPLMVTGDGHATFTPNAPGAYALVGVVNDGYESATANMTVYVRDPNDSNPPEAVITSPLDDAELRLPMVITGTVQDANLDLYRLVLQPVGSADYVELARGTTPVVSGELGRIDPTQLENGLYRLVLIARDTGGLETVFNTTVEIYGEAKVGNFSVAFRDVNIDAMGIPIVVTRAYDTRRRFENLDFGYGWSVDYRAGRVQKNMTTGAQWSVSREGPLLMTFCLRPVGKRTVMVSMPDGKLHRFDVRMSPECETGQAPQGVSPVFTPRPGTTSTLVAEDVGALVVQGDTVYDPSTGQPYSPTRFTLTTQEGFKYIVQEGVGILSVTDPKGNKLTYTTNGVQHSNGQGVQFVRNADGRIREVVDPAGNRLQYSYDSSGNLVSVTDAKGDVSTLTYNPQHALLSFTDPRNVLVLRNDYDADGRLIAQYDAEGNVRTLEHDLDQNVEVLTDRLGRSTRYEFDAMGNIVRQVDAAGGVTSTTYDAYGNELTVTDPLGRATTRTYWQDSDKVLSRQDALGNLTAFTYDGSGNQTSTRDARGHFSVNTFEGYDLKAMTDAEGGQTSFYYDDRGNMVTLYDAGGLQTINSYDARGNRTGESSGAGQAFTYTYDANNRELTRSEKRTTTAGVVTLTWSKEYDANGNVVKTIDPLGGVETTEYDSIGKVAARTDRRGQRTEYTYDGNGRLALTRFADGSTETVAYDAEGNKVRETDRAGREMRYAYDALNRLVRTEWPNGDSESSTYDAAGQLVASTDARGRTTTYAYDAAGRQVAVTDAQGRVTSYTHDANGNVLTMTSPRGKVTRYDYDKVNRRTATTLPNGRVLTVSYDAMGRKTAETLPSGRMVRYGYDALGRLTSVTDHLNRVTRYTYDEAGNKLTQTDAKGLVTRWTYDALNRVTSRTLPDGTSETYTPDAATGGQ